MPCWHSGSYCCELVSHSEWHTDGRGRRVCSSASAVTRPGAAQLPIRSESEGAPLLVDHSIGLGLHVGLFRAGTLQSKTVRSSPINNLRALCRSIYMHYRFLFTVFEHRLCLTTSACPPVAFKSLAHIGPNHHYTRPGSTSTFDCSLCLRSYLKNIAAFA